MSRIGKQPIEIPGSVDVVVDGSRVAVTGPRGSLEQTFHPEVSIRKDDGTIVVERTADDGLHRGLHGLTRTLIANMVEGVTNGYEKRLEIVGVGYRAALRAGPRARARVQPPGPRPGARGHRVRGPAADPDHRSGASTSSRWARSPRTSARSASPSRTRARACVRGRARLRRPARPRRERSSNGRRAEAPGPRAPPRPRAQARVGTAGTRAWRSTGRTGTSTRSSSTTSPRARSRARRRRRVAAATATSRPGQGRRRAARAAGQGRRHRARGVRPGRLNVPRPCGGPGRRRTRGRPGI